MKEIKKILPLYIIFITHIIAILLGNFINNKITNIFIITSFYLLIIYYVKKRKVKIIEIIGFSALLIIYIVGIYPNGIMISSIMMISFSMFLFIYFKKIKVKEELFVRFINFTYLIYLFLSILVYLNIINPGMIGRDELNIFTENVFNINIRTLVGFAGSTADIDSYSGFVFLVNIFLNNKKDKKFYSIISFFSLLLTFRNTPIVALIIVFVYWLISLYIKNRKKIKFIYSTLGIGILFSFLVPYIFHNTNIDFGKITHGRQIIWNQFCEVLKNSNIYSLLFGLRDNIPAVNISWADGIMENPHSSYLSFLLRFGLIIFILYWGYIILKLAKTKRAYRVIALYIFIAGITNSSIFIQGNPIYLISIYYFISKEESETHYKKRIRFNTLNLGNGGAEKVLINILNQINNEKYEISLLLIENKKIYINQLNNEVKVSYIFPEINFKSAWINNKYNFLKRNIIKYFSVFIINIDNEFDTEIAFLEGISTIMLSKSKNQKSKKIAWVHTDLEKLRSMSTKKEFQIYKKIDEIILVSKDAKKAMVNLYPDLEQKMKVIYNLMNNDEIIEKSKNERVDFNKNTIVSVGRLYNSKRFDLLIEAHKMLLEEGVENNLIIIGDGDEKEKLELLLDKYQLRDTVILKGFLKNPYPYIDSGTVFCVASDYEGFSLVVAEAMILGKAIVSTRCTGPVELLRNGECGILVDCNNPIKLKQALKSILIDEELRRQLEIKAKNRSKIFNEQIVIDQILKSI